MPALSRCAASGLVEGVALRTARGQAREGISQRCGEARGSARQGWLRQRPWAEGDYEAHRSQAIQAKLPLDVPSAFDGDAWQALPAKTHLTSFHRRLRPARRASPPGDLRALTTGPRNFPALGVPTSQAESRTSS